MAKRLFALMLVFALTLTMTACGNSGSSTPPAQSNGDGKADGATSAKPGGIQDDTLTKEPDHREGIGEVIPLSDAEKDYVLAQTTNSWLKLSKDQKSELTSLIGRWLEESHKFIVPDYDELVAMLDHQMEQYNRNNVNEWLMHTACDILNVKLPDDVPEKPSGVWDDGMGHDPNHGEGIGEVIALSDAEKDYVLAQTTNSWLKLSKDQKSELTSLIGRWLEESHKFIVPDYDELVVMLDRQMEQYFRNSVDEGVLKTVRDIYNLK